MKRLSLFILFVFLTICSYAGIQVKISSGIDNTALQTKMENSMSQLLSEVNEAQLANRALKLGQLGIPQNVQVSMSMLWENTHFICTESSLSLKCITTNNGYQFRAIPLQMKPSAYTKLDGDDYQEAVISYDQSGTILSFYLSLSSNQYSQVIRASKELTDLRRRQVILDYTERFRTAYNQKDIHFMEQIFSEDALIITGHVIKQKPVDGIALPDKILYKKYTKEEYLKNLRRTFANNSYIKVTFDEIKVLRHPTDPTIYGVTLHQGYSSSNYHDDGYLFILWDFSDESQPQILVRTWQPDSFNGGKLPEDQVFSLDDFDI